MENKSVIILNALIEKLKKNSHFFGNIACAEISGSGFSAADIAMDSGKDTPEVYRVIVIKHAR